MRPEFTLRIPTGLPADEAWRRLWDLRRHTEAVPLTAVTSDDGLPLAEGSRFNGRTGVGPLHLDDRMEVREWEPPRRAVIVKTGPFLQGSITTELHADGRGSTLYWHQTLGARGVPRALAALAAPLVGVGYRTALRRILG